MIQHKLKKLLVILDSAPPHKAVSLIKYFKSKSIKRIMIPGGLTGALQPGDTHWFSPMKRFVNIFFFNLNSLYILLRVRLIFKSFEFDS